MAAERRATGAPTGRWAVAAGLTLGVALLAGHPQTGMLVAYGSLVYGLYRFWPWPDARHPAAWRKPLGLLALFGLSGLGVAAVQLIPSWEFMALSTRARLGFEEAGRGFTTYDLLQIIFPQVGGQFPAFYVGILPLGLIALALTSVRCDPDAPKQARRTITFLGWGLLVAVLLSFGASLGLYFLAYLLIPGWKLFRGQERTIAWAVFAAALLAGYGAAWLRQRWATLAPTAPHLQSSAHAAGDTHGDENAAIRVPSRSSASHVSVSGRPPETWLAAGFGLAALAAVLLAVVFWVGYLAGHEALWGFTAASLALALFAFLSLIAVRSGRVVLVLAVIALDLFTYNPAHHAGATGQAGLEQYRTFLAAPVADTGIFRMANEDALPANYGLLYRLEDLRGASPLQLAAYQKFLARIPVPRAWQMLNVKYVLTWRGALEAPAERLAEITGRDGNPIYLYRLAKTGPRAWLAGEVIIAADREQAWQHLAAAGFDPARQVVLPALPAGFTPDPACAGQITWLKREPEHLALSVTADRTCVLVLSELFYPGWQATVDGAAAPILQADAILRAIPLAPGQHEVRLVYRPTSVLLGGLISLATVVVALTWLVSGSRIRRS